MPATGRTTPVHAIPVHAIPVHAIPVHAIIVGAAIVLLAAPASAFCGFYVGGGDAELFNDATMVVLMREGTRTVLSMQNSYEGPPENFALIVPVPEVLTERTVRTLHSEVFDRTDRMAAPRLVEYWEQDPCPVEMPMEEERTASEYWEDLPLTGNYEAREEDGVVIEAEFTVGEYEIVILSSEDSTALDTWIRNNGYQIPEGAEEVLRPYVEAGLKFFVARVDIEQVAMVDGKAVLSPLRFHYDTEEFALPVRLGLLNSKGTQDLIVHILAPGQRYELANLENVTIPTNIIVDEAVRDQFGSFYTTLFQATVDRNPGAAITEYAWQAASCDPCPDGQLLTGSDIQSLGGDAIPSGWSAAHVLTRIHLRYSAETLTEDLVFRAAEPIVGGRGTPSTEGTLEYGAQPGGSNNFQGRYAILHWWEGAIECEHPQRGIWGGPPGGGNSAIAAEDQGFARPEGGVVLEEAILQSVPDLDIVFEAER